ncbi:MAG: hypothetical protein JJE17_01770 [Peptostreptococcaceae bacterium]|nr:hypothetical protein [Peptostreptococcaceae bacterium]
MDKNNQQEEIKSSNVVCIGVVEDKQLGKLEFYEVSDMSVEEWNSL